MISRQNIRDGITILICGILFFAGIVIPYFVQRETATLNMTELRKQLIRHEGLRLYPYRCPSGKLTIGVGRNLQDLGITRDEALYLLENDINECLRDCRGLFPNFETLSDVRKRVLIDMRFNLGPGKFREFENFIDAVVRNDFKSAHMEIVDSLWHGQVGNRAKCLAKMIRDGDR